MTERRITPDPGADHDAVVSETYRDIATERAPDHLNRAVLDAARKAGRPGYLRWRTWTRPAAWAAVVMLSVAILIETDQAPMPESTAPMADKASADAPMATRDAEADADTEADAEVAERKLESQLMKSDPGDAQALTVKDQDLIERAEEMERMQSGRIDQPEPAAASRAAPAAAQQAAPESSAAFALSLEETPPACDEAARANAEAWLECILDLEQAGFADAARQERELLAETFPDFEPQ